MAPCWATSTTRCRLGWRVSTANTSQTMAWASCCRAASDSAPARRCLALAKSLTGTTAHTAVPSGRRQGGGKIQHAPGQPVLVFRAAHPGRHDPDRHAQLGNGRLVVGVGLVVEQAVPHPRIVPVLTSN